MIQIIWVIAGIMILIQVYKFYKEKAFIENEKELSSSIEKFTMLHEHVLNKIKSENDIQ